MFRGTFEHTIDAKGRTSLPARFRDKLTQAGQDRLVVTQGPDKCLWAMTLPKWEEFESRIAALPQFDPVIQRLVRWVVAPAQDCALDGMGRILVPPTLRAWADLSGEVVWAGAIHRIELWSKARWQKLSEEATSAFEDGSLGRTLAGYGL